MGYDSFGVIFTKIIFDAILYFMSGSLARFTVRPLFYEVLSGEVHPPSDSQRRDHTLGRLAYEAVSEGNAEIIGETDPGYLLYRYRPSWASHVLATAECDMEEGEWGEVPTQLRSIELSDTTGRTLLVADENFDGPQNAFVGTLESDVRVPLRLDESLSTARITVTAAAQSFFDLAD